ncbi:MAG: efflux transporter outer membrane subunit [Xanthomonadales bacterium]|nr:efflux transporter outer membrane subunit [Gammaproteobacteria bacterium]MBT8052521.1 efflux transporter outer membrane subunit [Gammaproteobacteria bacterium]NND57105.1 efflux transporter outer membrane subunit [Xanthomonadales bacterium]NNK52755.1 efflux transporter outer membrane subunit [Xanthomonadales bacterium]
MRRVCRSLLISTATVILASCTMGPDYKRPEVPVPDTFRSSTANGESIANLEWWELFDDADLVDLIEMALANNRELAIATARIEEARASLGFVRADQFPNLGGSAGASRGNQIPGIGVPGGVNDSFVLAADLSFEVDLWGKLRRSTEAARAELLSTVEARNVVTITLIADVASIYLLLLDLDDRVEIAERTRQTREDALRLIEARFDRGTVPLIDVNQAQIELADAIAEKAALERQRGLAENSLSVLLGRNPGPIQRSLDNPVSALKIPAIPAGLPSELLERRPDIRQASQELAAQTARIGVAEALRFPSLSLTGSLGLASDDLNGFISSDNKVWGISANLLGPLFDAGRNRSRVEAERARTEQLLGTYQLTVLRSFQEVDDALIEISTYRQEAEAREAQVRAASSAAMLSRARYDGGVTSYLEVLESERSLFRAELLASSTRRAQVVSIVGLYKALGGGWVNDASEAEPDTP